MLHQVKKKITICKLWLATTIPYGDLVAFIFDPTASPHPLSLKWLRKIYFWNPVLRNVLAVPYYINKAFRPIRVNIDILLIFTTGLVYLFTFRFFIFVSRRHLKEWICRVTFGKELGSKLIERYKATGEIFLDENFQTSDDLIAFFSSNTEEIFGGKCKEVSSNSLQKLRNYWKCVQNDTLDNSLRNNTFLNGSLVEKLRLLVDLKNLETHSPSSGILGFNINNFVYALSIREPSTLLPLALFKKFSVTFNFYPIPVYKREELAPIKPIFMGKNNFTIFEDEADLMPLVMDLIPPYDYDKPVIYFINNDYYFFNHLSLELERNGFFSKIVTYDPPSATLSEYSDLVTGYGGTLASEHDQNRLQALVFRIYLAYADYIHTYGDVRHHVFYPDGAGNILNFNHRREAIPYDAIFLRRAGIKFGASMAGCVPLHSKTQFRETTGVCLQCKFNNDENSCSDDFSKNGYHSFFKMMDLIANEGEYAFGFRDTEKSVYLPFATGISMERLLSNSPPADEPGRLVIAIPSRSQKLAKTDQHKTLRIIHAVGHFEARSNEEFMNSKGSQHLIRAVEELVSEGVGVSLEVITGMDRHSLLEKITDYDLVVDQLVYGRLGAFAREVIGTGTPLLTAWDFDVKIPMQETVPPIVAANYLNVKETIKNLAQNQDFLLELASKQTCYFMTNYSLEVTSKRFIEVVENLVKNDKPPRESEKAYLIACNCLNKS